MDKQKMFDLMLERIERDNKKEGYGELLEFLSGLSAD